MTDASFESGTRAATRQELQEAQRKYRLVMQRAAPNLRPDAHRNCLQLATSADLDALSRASIANIAELQIDRCSDVVPLAQLVDFPALTILRLGGLDRITDLEWLPHLPRLRTMRLEGFGADFASLTGISAAPALEALVLDALRARDR